MRSAPIAMRFRSSPDRLVRDSIDITRITHADPKATWGAVAIDQAIAHLLSGGDIARVLDAAKAGVAQPNVLRALDDAATLAYDDVASGGYVLDTITASLWCLLHRPNLEEAVVTAVAMGSDTDTTGAVCGALAGAAYGVGAIPARWLDVIHHREEMEHLADQLLAWDVADSTR